MPTEKWSYREFPRAKQELPGMETYTANPDLPGIAMAGNVIYTAQSGMGLRLQILYPIYQPYGTRKREKWPCIVHIHGSGWRTQDVYRRIPALCRLAEKGYVIFSAEYRPSQTAPFPAQIRDAKAAVRWVRLNAETYNGDPERIAVMGDSSGGHTALLTHMTQGEPFFAPDAYAGVSDETLGCLALYPPTDIGSMNSAPTNMDHTAADSPEGMLFGRRAISEIPQEELAMAAAETWGCSGRFFGPVLLVHGDKDDTVPFAQSAELYLKLLDTRADAAFCLVRGVEFWEEPMVDRYDRFFQKVFQK